MHPWQYRPWPISLSELLFILIAFMLGTWFIAKFVGPFLAGDGPSTAAFVVLVIAQNALLLFLVRALAIGRHGLVWPELGVGPFDPRQVPYALLMAVLALLLANLVLSMMMSGYEQPPENPQSEALRSLGTDPATALTVILLASTIVPFIEEVAYRGLLYGWLRQRFDIWPSVTISSFAFAVMHDSLLLLVPITVVGIVLALLYERHQSIWPCVIAHGAFNAVSLIGFYYVSSANGTAPSAWLTGA